MNPPREQNFYRGEKYISNRWKTFSFSLVQSWWRRNKNTKKSWAHKILSFRINLVYGTVLLLITEKGLNSVAYVVCVEGNCRASNIICPLVARHIGIMKLNIHIAHTPRCTAFTICTCRTLVWLPIPGDSKSPIQNYTPQWLPTTVNYSVLHVSSGLWSKWTH